MKRTVKFSFSTDKSKYVFYESEEKKLEIDVKDKVLLGNDLYKIFFKDYKKGDVYELIDNTTDAEKNLDKMCKPIFDKINELFKSIQDEINEEIFDSNENELETSSDKKDS